MNAQGRCPLFPSSFYTKPNIILWSTISFMLSASLMNRIKYPTIMVFACKRDYLLSVKDYTWWDWLAIKRTFQLFKWDSLPQTEFSSVTAQDAASSHLHRLSLFEVDNFRRKSKDRKR